MALDEQSGRRHSRGYESLGFAGALLMDLILQGNITLKQKKVEIIDIKPTGDINLDEILKIIKNSKRKRSTMSWIDRLSLIFKKYYYLYLDHMEQEVFLRSEIRPILKTKCYFLKELNIKTTLLEKINNLVLNNLEPSIDTIFLLALLDVSKLIKAYMSWGLRRKARYFLEKSLNSERIDSLIREMILSIRKEILNVVGARYMSISNDM